MSTLKTNQLQHTANGAAVYTLPQSDGSNGQVLKTDGSGNLSWYTIPEAAGTPITVVTAFRNTSNRAGDVTTLDTWGEESGEQSTGKISTGGAVTHSSGVFSFPVTGYYLILAQATFGCNGDSRYNNFYLKTSTDGGSNWDDASHGTTGISKVENDNTYGQIALSYCFDVTDTSTHKIGFKTSVSNNSTVLEGNTSQMTSAVWFIRIGDT